MSEIDLVKEMLDAKKKLEEMGQRNVNAMVHPSVIVDQLSKDEHFVAIKDEHHRFLRGRIGDMLIYESTLPGGPQEMMAILRGENDDQEG